MRLLALTLAFAAVTATASADLLEARVQECTCHGMMQEVALSNGTRVDCMDDKTVTEIDRSRKWAEAIGQALLYSIETGKRGRVILYCGASSRSACAGHVDRFRSVIEAHRLPITLVPMSGEAIAAACGVR